MACKICRRTDCEGCASCFTEEAVQRSDAPRSHSFIAGLPRQPTDMTEAQSAHAVSNPQGWNWGGFLLTWIWAICNRSWLGLFALLPWLMVPYAIDADIGNFACRVALCVLLPGIAFATWLGIKGNEMAWNARKWKDLAHFKRVQRNWATAGLWLWGVLLLGCLPLLWIGGMVLIFLYSKVG